MILLEVLLFMEYLKKLPLTSIDQYISGYYALNIPDKDGIPADWHPRLYWFSVNKNETVPLYNTNSIFGTQGIHYRKVDCFSCAGYDKVYIADHVRAIADLVATLPDISVLRGCVNDWLRTEEQERQLYNMLLKIDKIGKTGWFLREEFTKFYIGGKLHGTVSER